MARPRVRRATARRASARAPRPRTAVVGDPDIRGVAAVWPVNWAAVSHRPMLVVWGGFALAIVLGFVAAVRPLEVQALAVAPLLVAGTLALFRRGFARFEPHAWLTSTAKTGVFLRIGFVAVHLVIGFWFYGGEVDFIGW